MSDAYVPELKLVIDTVVDNWFEQYHPESRELPIDLKQRRERHIDDLKQSLFENVQLFKNLDMPPAPHVPIPRGHVPKDVPIGATRRPRRIR